MTRLTRGVEEGDAGDTVPLTGVTSALARGDLRAAASAPSLPNPPGYPLLAAPFVAALPSAVGSPSWCTPSGRVRPDAKGRSGSAGGPAGPAECGLHGTDPALPPWYRAQGVLGMASWPVLAVGALAVLGAARVYSLARQARLLVSLAYRPATGGAIVQLYHPRYVVSLGLSLAGPALVLRRRWLFAGVLFGVAVLTKQIAVLLLLPAPVAAPDRRARRRLVTPAAVVFAVDLLPLLAIDPRATLENLSGFGGGGAAAGPAGRSPGHPGGPGPRVHRESPGLRVGGSPLTT